MDALAFALSMAGVIGRGALTGCAGDRFGVIGRGELAGCCAGNRFGVIGLGPRAAGCAGDSPLGVVARPVEEGGLEVEDEGEELRRVELTVGRRKDGTGLSDADAGEGLREARDRRQEAGSELAGRALDDVGLPLVLRGRALLPSREPGVGRVAMGCSCWPRKTEISSNHFACKNWRSAELMVGNSVC